MMYSSSLQQFLLVWVAVLSCLVTCQEIDLQGLPKKEAKGIMYCEIISGPRLDGRFRVAMNVSGCPASPGYFDIVGSDIREKHGWWYVAGFNGRREYIMDEIFRKALIDENYQADPELNTYVEYGSGIFPDGSGFLMEIVATVSVNIIIASGPFQKLIVERPYILKWNAGQLAYVITEPNCKQIWIMQTLNHATHPQVNRPGVFTETGSPPGDGSGEPFMQDIYNRRELKVPDGWDYYTTILKEDVIYHKEDNLADVTPDHFGNSYTGLVPGTHEWLCRSNTMDETSQQATNKSEL